MPDAVRFIIRFLHRIALQNPHRILNSANKFNAMPLCGIRVCVCVYLRVWRVYHARLKKIPKEGDTESINRRINIASLFAQKATSCIYLYTPPLRMTCYKKKKM